MNSTELFPGIYLYKNINLDIADEIMSLDSSQWEYEMTQKNGNVVLDLDQRNTLSLEIPFKPIEQSTELQKKFSKSLNQEVKNLNQLLSVVK